MKKFIVLAVTIIALATGCMDMEQNFWPEREDLDKEDANEEVVQP